MKSLVLIAIMFFFGATSHMAQAQQTERPFNALFSSETCEGTVVVQLELNADGSFHYIDKSIPGKVVDVSGTWNMDGRKITLHEKGSSALKRNSWKLEKGKLAVKSRYRLCFYRLGRD
ncbi:hypothetical protein GC194_00040 [bacterium]|nr:hypothetical protein [bacterium]